jgi:hypothetical protein
MLDLPAGESASRFVMLDLPAGGYASRWIFILTNSFGWQLNFAVGVALIRSAIIKQEINGTQIRAKATKHLYTIHSVIALSDKPCHDDSAFNVHGPRSNRSRTNKLKKHVGCF